MVFGCYSYWIRNVFNLNKGLNCKCKDMCWWEEVKGIKMGLCNNSLSVIWINFFFSCTKFIQARIYSLIRYYSLINKYRAYTKPQLQKYKPCPYKLSQCRNAIVKTVEKNKKKKERLTMKFNKNIQDLYFQCVFMQDYIDWEVYWCYFIHHKGEFDNTFQMYPQKPLY